MKKHNPDNREDNVDSIQQNITSTIENIRKANELIAITSDDKLKATLKEKNDRRSASLDGFRQEIKDEATDKI